MQECVRVSVMRVFVYQLAYDCVHMFLYMCMYHFKRDFIYDSKCVCVCVCVCVRVSDRSIDIIHRFQCVCEHL
jgi:hypothetical protein